MADAIDNKSFEFASVLKKAKNLSQTQKVELSNLKDIKNQLEKCLKVVNDRAEKAKQEALAKADEEALLAEQVRNSPRDEITSSLAKLASFPPDKSGKNPYRPDWIDYDIKQQIWKVNPNKLAI